MTEHLIGIKRSGSEALNQGGCRKIGRPQLRFDECVKMEFSKAETNWRQGALQKRVVT